MASRDRADLGPLTGAHLVMGHFSEVDVQVLRTTAQDVRGLICGRVLAHHAVGTDGRRASAPMGSGPDHLLTWMARLGGRPPGGCAGRLLFSSGGGPRDELRTGFVWRLNDVQRPGFYGC